MGARLEVIFRPAVPDDLRGILRFIVESSGAIDTALAYIDRIEARCHRLGEFPLSGHLREDLGAGIRTMPFEGTMIAYIVEADAVAIVRVFARGQDFESTLRDS